jgi:hypothetical protein
MHIDPIHKCVFFCKFGTQIRKVNAKMETNKSACLHMNTKYLGMSCSAHTLKFIIFV